MGAVVDANKNSFYINSLYHSHPDGGKQGKHYNAGEKNKKLKQHHEYE